MGARYTSGKGRLALDKKGPWPGGNTERRGPWQGVVVAIVYPFAARAIESGGPALMGKGRVLPGVRTALWKRSRPPQAWQIGCGQGGSSISGTVTVKPWASSTQWIEREGPQTDAAGFFVGEGDSVFLDLEDAVIRDGHLEDVGGEIVD